MSASRTARLAVVLAAVAGFVDAACYLTLHRLFVAHVTGDSNLLGQHIGRGDVTGAIPLAVTILVFALSIFLATIGIELATRRRLRSPLALALLAEALLLLVVMVDGSPGRGLGGYYVLLVLAVADVGIQTAALAKCGGRTVRTTYLSGMTTRFAQELAHSVVAPADRRAPSYLRDELGLDEHARSVWLYAALVVAFVAGASLAAFSVVRIALWSLAFPVAVLLGLAGGAFAAAGSHPAAATPRGPARLTLAHPRLPERELDRP
jgi:uncharacterized membrane protein YoaK (UPF0700 family)